MNKSEALEILRHRREKEMLNDNEELLEMIDNLIIKAESIAEIDFETFDEDPTFGSVRRFVEVYKKKVKRRKSVQTTTYYKLQSIDKTTEKAIAVAVGSNHLHGSRNKTYYQWIPRSITVNQIGNTYIPAWFVNKENLWDVVDTSSMLKI